MEQETEYFSRVTGVSLNEQQVLPSWLVSERTLEDDLTPEKVNRRFVYAENLWSEESAINLFATHILDEEIGKIV